MAAATGTFTGANKHRRRNQVEAPTQRGFSADAAAKYCGWGRTKFDDICNDLAEGFPQPFLAGRMKMWDRALGFSAANKEQK